jgi:hypothetical protein
MKRLCGSLLWFTEWTRDWPHGALTVATVRRQYSETFRSQGRTAQAAGLSRFPESLDKAGKTEVVNYELENGVYVIPIKVLRPGEKFRLVLGKQQAWIALT